MVKEKRKKYRVPLPPLPQKSYSVKIKGTDKVFTMDPKKIPHSKDGLPGSILSLVVSQDAGLIDHACGGVQACSTCHIYVHQGLDSCNESSEREEDYIDKAMGPRLESRLACCCVPDGSEDIEIEIPNWNINMVKEGHH